MLKPICNKQEVTADPFSKTVWTTYFFRHLHVHIFTFSQQSKPGLSATRLSGIISRAEEHQLHHPVLQGWRKFLGKTTNKHAAEEWMDFIVKPKTWSRHRLRGLGRDWSLFIHKCWKGSVHTPHVEVLFLNQVHMAALLCPRQHEMFRARRGGRFWVTVLNRNDALDTGIWWRGNNAAPQLSPEPPHTWRQLYQTVFSGNSPQLKTNSYPSVSPPSVFLLLARTCGSKPSSCLQRSSWSLSPPLQRCPAHDERLSRSYFKFQDKKKQRSPRGAAMLWPRSTTSEWIILPSIESFLFASSPDKLSVTLHEWTHTKCKELRCVSYRVGVCFCWKRWCHHHLLPTRSISTL